MVETTQEALPKTERGTQTRALILETALRLFEERGYDETTMRAIAEEAGVSLGNAYYYFRSKEHLIQAFYGRMHEMHNVTSRPVLDRETSFKLRLKGVLHGKLQASEPYHRFSGILFKTAADPESPLNPFSPESAEIRAESTALFEEVVTGSDLRVPRELGEKLPSLLWTYHMGIVLFWIYDRSPGRARTYRLVEHSANLIDKLLTLATIPIARPLLNSVLRMIDDVERDAGNEQ